MGNSSELSDLKLRILDIQASIRTDSAGFANFFARMYRHFLVDEFDPGSGAPLEFHFYRSSHNPWGYPLLSLAGEIWPFTGTTSLEGYAYDGILGTILANVGSYFVIHAGVVARNGRAVLVAADSGHGKTTLVLALARRGFQLLSDELAPLRRTDGQVQPFPRSLRVRPGTLELAGLELNTDQNPIWFDKLILDIDQIQPGSRPEPASLSAVIVLKEPDDELPDPGSEKELGIFLSRIEPELVRQASQIEGVTRAWSTSELGYPVLRIQSEQRMRALAQVEAYCKERQILILDVNKRPLRKPSFTSPANIEPLSKSQAVMELLRQFQPGHKSRLIGELGGPTRLYLELARLLESVDCYQLSPGPLTEMIRIVEEISG